MNSIENQGQFSYNPSGEVYSQVLGGEAVLLDVGSGTYWGLDEVGTRIWELLELGESLEAIAATLAGEYDAEAAAIAGDVAGFIELLRAKGLLQGSSVRS